jgi:LysM repeat protein
MGVHTVNKEKPIRDQAERLRKRVDRKTGHAIEKKETLPPRSEIHRQKQKKTNVKVKYPVIRLMALFFILLPVIFFSVISYLEGAKGPLNHVAERAGIELINVESSEIENNSNEEDEEGPAIEEITETDQIDVASSPAPNNDNDKNNTTSVQAEGEAANQKPEGQKPADTQTTSEAAAATPDTNAGGGEKIIYHTVQPSETLFRVAMKYYKSQEGIEVIKKANNIMGNEIQAGQVLKIPLKK